MPKMLYLRKAPTLRSQDPTRQTLALPKWMTLHTADSSTYALKDKAYVETTWPDQLCVSALKAY